MYIIMLYIHTDEQISMHANYIHNYPFIHLLHIMYQLVLMYKYTIPYCMFK